MIVQRRITKGRFFSILLLTVLSFGNKVNAQDGKALFTANCASCHGVLKGGTGPALTGVETRGPWGDRKKLYDWIHNPAGFMEGDAYTQGLKATHGNVMMQAFPGLATKDIDAIIDYVNSVKPPSPTEGPTGDSETGKIGESDNAIL